MIYQIYLDVDDNKTHIVDVKSEEELKDIVANLPENAIGILKLDEPNELIRKTDAKVCEVAVVRVTTPDPNKEGEVIVTPTYYAVNSLKDLAEEISKPGVSDAGIMFHAMWEN